MLGCATKKRWASRFSAAKRWRGARRRSAPASGHAGLHGVLTHQAGHTMPTHSQPLRSQLRMHARPAEPTATRLVDGSNPLDQHLLLLRSTRAATLVPRVSSSPVVYSSLWTSSGTSWPADTWAAGSSSAPAPLHLLNASNTPEADHLPRDFLRHPSPDPG